MAERWRNKAGRPGWRFHPAPDWPLPPPGWQPFPGWQPDPSWPTPPRWRWLRRTRLKVVSSVVAVAAAVALVVGLFVAEGIAEAGGHSLDPTDPMNYDSFALVNDSPSTLYVHLCADSRCSRLESHFDWTAIAPGSSETEQVYWDPGSFAAYAVSDRPGRNERCLRLDASTEATAKVSVHLSSARSCGDPIAP